MSGAELRCDSGERHENEIYLLSCCRPCIRAGIRTRRNNRSNKTSGATTTVSLVLHPTSLGSLVLRSISLIPQQSLPAGFPVSILIWPGRVRLVYPPILKWRAPIAVGKSMEYPLVEAKNKAKRVERLKMRGWRYNFDSSKNCNCGLRR